jgi:precorrin-2 dehydrogenase / sirohydrochlorin ferrochelatase
MLRLEGHLCLTVGGGAVAARKVERLLDAEAAVRVVAPLLSSKLARLTEAGRIEWMQREYQGGDLVGAMLAFAATSSAAVNLAVAAEAAERGIPVNVADDRLASTFQVPAKVARGGVTLAISTAGRSPAYARRLREELERFLSPERLALLDLYADLRSDLVQQGQSVDGRAWSAADDRALELLRAGRRAEASNLLREQVMAGRGD